MYRFIDLTTRPCKLVQSNTLSDLCLLVQSNQQGGNSSRVLCYSSLAFPGIKTKSILTSLYNVGFDMVVYYDYRGRAIGFAFGRTGQTGDMNVVLEVGEKSSDYVVIPRSDFETTSSEQIVAYNWYGSTQYRVSFTDDNLAVPSAPYTSATPGIGVLSINPLDPKMGAKVESNNLFAGGFVSC